MPRLSMSVWALLALLLGASIGCLSPAFGADQKPLVINPSTGKQEQMQTGNNLLIPGTSTLTVSSLTSGRVPFASTAGLVTDSANLQWTGTQLQAVGSGGVFTQQAATQDAMRVIGRAGGTGSFVGTLTPTTLSASRTWTLTDATGTVPLLESTQTFTAVNSFSNTTPSTSISTGAVQNSGGYAAARASFLRGVASSSDANAVVVNFFSNQSVNPVAYRTGVQISNSSSGASAGNSSVTAGVTTIVNNVTAGVTWADARGYEADVSTGNATAAITTGYGYYFKNGTATGTMTNKYAFYTEGISGGTTNYAFRSAGAGLVRVDDTTEASAVGTASVITAGGLGIAKRSFLGTIGGTFKGNVVAGVQDATAAVAGQVGEVLTGNQSTYTNMAATATYGQITTVSLTAGDWDITGFFTIAANGATLTATANTIATISTTTASAAGTTEGLGDIGYISEVINGASGRASVTLHKRVNISATTSYFLNAQATYTAGTPQAVGSLVCTRIR